ncbi:tastin isoform X1 [Sorex fumeus]|uniref:tastin isoform X1 n=1 Tax=Sorex fumeus TaxID=62283 RepID=UPI0024AD8B83|nr:tastin isoform X1 [Sorex fumeus]
MTTLPPKRDLVRRGVSPTPSKIPVSSRRRPPPPTDKPGALDQENQDPKRLVRKLSTQRPLHDSADPRPKALHEAKKSERLVGSPQFRNPLEELKPSPGGQNVGPRPRLQTEASGAVDFVADPAALATILSGEGVKSCHLGRHTSLAQRVLIRVKPGGTDRRGQGVRSSAYLAPRTPAQRLDPTRASCFSRLEGPGPRSQTSCPQRLEELIPSSDAPLRPATHPSFQELRRETGGGSRTAASQASGLLPDTPVQPASSLPGREHEVVTHSGEGGGAPLSLAQRVPLRETQERTHTRDSCDPQQMFTPGRVAAPATARPSPSPFGRAQRVPSPGPSAQTYSVLRRLANRPKTQYTPLPSASRVQQAQLLTGLSPQPCPEEPTLPWEQITVRLFDQETCKRLQEGTGKPPAAATPSGPSPSRTLSFQELKMQRITILQQLLRQEVLGLTESESAPSAGGSASLDMTELQPLLADVSRTLGTPEPHPGTLHLPTLLEHSETPKPCPPEESGQPQPGPGAEAEVAQPCPPAEPGPRESSRRDPEPPEASAQEQPDRSESGPLHTQRQAWLAEPPSGVECGASQARSLDPRSPEASPPPGCHRGAPVTTSTLGASPSSCSFRSPRPPMGQAGPCFLAPHTLALRQRLQACLSAIHGFHEARLDDECAFYTSRAPPPGLTRVCTNPVATLLEWQDALSFIPVGSAALQDSPS